MPDVRPPRLAGDERDTPVALLEYLREPVVRTVDGATEAGAAASPVPTGTSLRRVVAHPARAESTWVEARFAGRPPRDDAEPATLREAVDTYRATWARVDVIVAASSLEDVCAADVARPPVNPRWVLAHLLEETARHAGHADVLRELLDGGTGR